MDLTDTSRPTFAIVVAIETYADAKLNVEGPAKAALGVAKYLHEVQKLPASQIRLFATFRSPESSRPFEESGYSASAIGEPNFDTLRSFLSDPGNPSHWPGAVPPKGARLVLYWCGHGFEGPNDERQLLYSDATVTDARNLDVVDLVRVWRQKPGGAFPEQLAFIDACAEQRKLAPLRFDDYPKQAFVPSQYFYFAAPRGHHVQAGAFTAIVLGALADYRDGKWPAPDALWEKIDRNDSGIPAPIRITYSDSRGNKRVDSPPIISEIPTTSTRRLGLFNSLLLLAIVLINMTWGFRVWGIGTQITLPATAVAVVAFLGTELFPLRLSIVVVRRWMRKLLWLPAATPLLLTVFCALLYFQWVHPVLIVSVSGTQPVYVYRADDNTPVQFPLIGHRLPPDPRDRVVVDLDRSGQEAWLFESDDGRGTVQLHCQQPVSAPFLGIGLHAPANLSLPVAAPSVRGLTVKLINNRVLAIDVTLTISDSEIRVARTFRLEYKKTVDIYIDPAIRRYNSPKPPSFQTDSDTLAEAPLSESGRYSFPVGCRTDMKIDPSAKSSYPVAPEVQLSSIAIEEAVTIDPASSNYVHTLNFR